MNPFPDRACPRCSALAPCVGWVEQHLQSGHTPKGQSGGIPSGKELIHQCSACHHRFRIIGPTLVLWSLVVVGGLSYVALNWIRTALDPRHSIWKETLTWGVLCGLLAIGALVQLGWRIRLRQKTRLPPSAITSREFGAPTWRS